VSLFIEIPADRSEVPFSGLLLKVGAEDSVLPRLYCHRGLLKLGFITSELSGPKVFLPGVSSASVSIEVLVDRPKVSFPGRLLRVGAEVLLLPFLY
jgi:hypothetical protein